MQSDELSPADLLSTQPDCMQQAQQPERAPEEYGDEGSHLQSCDRIASGPTAVDERYASIEDEDMPWVEACLRLLYGSFKDLSCGLVLLHSPRNSSAGVSCVGAECDGAGA